MAIFTIYFGRFERMNFTQEEPSTESMDKDLDEVPKLKGKQNPNANSCQFNHCLNKWQHNTWKKRVSSKKCSA